MRYECVYCKQTAGILCWVSAGETSILSPQSNFVLNNFFLFLLSDNWTGIKLKVKWFDCGSWMPPMIQVNDNTFNVWSAASTSTVKRITKRVRGDTLYSFLETFFKNLCCCVEKTPGLRQKNVFFQTELAYCGCSLNELLSEGPEFPWPHALTRYSRPPPPTPACALTNGHPQIKPHPSPFQFHVHKTWLNKTPKQHCPLSCFILHFKPQHSQSEELRYPFVKPLQPFHRWGVLDHSTHQTKDGMLKIWSRIWQLTSPPWTLGQASDFCRAYNFHPSSSPCTAAFSIPSLSNYPSPRVQNCNAQRRLGLWIITDVLFFAFCGRLWGPLLHILHTHMEVFTPSGKKKKLSEPEPLEATGSNVGCWRDPHFFTLTPKRMERCARKDSIPPPAYVLYYPPPFNFCPLFSLALLATWYALIHDHCDDKHIRPYYIPISSLSIIQPSHRGALISCPALSPNEKSCPRCVLCGVGSDPGLISAIWISPLQQERDPRADWREESRLTVTSAAVTLASCPHVFSWASVSLRPQSTFSHNSLDWTWHSSPRISMISLVNWGAWNDASD